MTASTSRAPSSPASFRSRTGIAASRKQINATRLLKQQLMVELSNWIAEHQLKQADAAQILMVSRPRVCDVVNQKTAKFTIDTLVELLSRVGKPVKLAVG
jgi:predicted XRE-type DNA-binding protein